MRPITLAILGAGLSLPGLASAQAYPPNALLSGEVQQKVVSNQCYVVRGSSDFLRNGAANRAFVSVSDMVADGYELNGHMTLVFTSTTGGTAHFSLAPTYPSNILAASFAGYKQSYQPATKNFRAQFILKFPGCSLPVSGLYTSP